MTIKVFLIGLILTFSLYSINAEELKDSTRLYGKAAEYAGFNIVFESYSNFIIPKTKAIASMPINDDGSFDFTFELTEPTYAYVDLGKYRASIYLEPGITYNIVLPPFEPKSEVDRLNPLFQQEEVLLGIRNKESRQLNRNITEFNAEFDYLLAEHALQLFLHTDTLKAKEIQKTLNEKYNFSHPIFIKHKQLSFLKLWQPALHRQQRQVIAKLVNTPIEYNLPAYWEIFSSLFKGFLPNGFQKDIKPLVLNAITQRAPFPTIVKAAMTDTLFTQKPFTELVLLYGLYEAYYNKTISETTILDILNNASTTASNSKIKEIAKQFFEKTSMLRVGTKAPDFTLIDAKGKSRSLSNYQGKFVYLNFIHTQNYACQRDLIMLEQYQKLMRKELEIVTIVLDDSYDAMTRFVKDHPYKWDFLHFGVSPIILENYNIMAIPAYYLIDPNGNLSLSPAPAPEENFKKYFADRFLQFQRDEIRRNPPKQRSIFR